MQGKKGINFKHTERHGFMAKSITQAEWEEDISAKILNFTRNELYLDLRFMDIALSSLTWKRDDTISTLATDGEFLYYCAGQLSKVFKSNSRFLNRLYLHSILHCIYGHLWLCGDRSRGLWDIACDIIVEYTIDGMDKPALKRPLSFTRKQVYGRIDQYKNTVSAPVIYNTLFNASNGDIEKLQKEFYTDSHIYWPKEKKLSPAANNAMDKWDKISRQSQMELESRGENEKDGAKIFDERARILKRQRSYSSFLRKFARLNEELKCDPDEFDLNYYTYGLSLYGSLPLIEPLESRETVKIQEFVVAVDTSYSTSGEMVKGFLRETYNILADKNSFFSGCHMRIIQCDNDIRMDLKIKNKEELLHVLDNFHIIGGGGTDFRPVFSYVNSLLEKKVLKNLGGLVYFTDGKGIYPRAKPAYKTAFIFADNYDKEKVPPWAMKMQIDPLHLHHLERNGEYNGYKES